MNNTTSKSEPEGELWQHGCGPDGKPHRGTRPVRVDWAARHREVDESIGRRFGSLVIERRDHRNHGSKGLHVFARCDCGAEKLLKFRHIASGNTSTCGLAQHRDWEARNRGLEVVGQRFGALVVIGELAERDESRTTQVRVRCDCGAECLARLTDLRGGTVKTCRGPAHLAVKPETKRWEVRGKASTYVLEAVGTGMIKVGRARDLAERMHKLQASCPVQLVAIALCDDDIERSLHVELTGFRSHGEWFRKCEESMAIIARRTTPANIAAEMVTANPGTPGWNAGRKYKCKACGEEGHQARTCRKLFNKVA